MKRDRMRIYISGKVSGTDDYVERFRSAEMILEERGMDVVNPVTMCSSLPTNLTHAEYMKICLAALDCCDAIYMLTGYKSSAGAIQEIGYAKGRGLLIYGE